MNRLHQNPSQPGKIEKPQNSALAVNRLLAYLSPFRLRLWIVFFFVVIYSLLGLAGPLLFWFTQFVARYTRKGVRELQKQLGEMNSVMEESISGLKVIKAFRRNDEVIDTFRIENNKVFKASVYANSYSMLLMPLTNVLGNLFIIVIAAFGGWLALKGLVTVGVIASFIIYGQNFIQPLRQLATMYNTIQSALAGSERIFEILDIPSEVDITGINGPITIAGAIRFDHVRFG